MEGAGEGVVAILQGTKHAGLRVTLIPDNRFRHKRKCVIMDLDARPQTRVTQSSVETNTERVFKNASAPMCDVRYASSYRFANCKPVQSSFRVSEFSQQSTLYRHRDQFADSLRKYPVPGSSEILQRIINYSNIKQNDRKQNLKSIRSLLRKSTSQQMNRRYRYENGVNTNPEIYERRPINKSISIIGNKYSSRNTAKIKPKYSQKELLNYTYDYLKCISLIPRCTDVRYLTQVKKCIRNRLLEIIDDRPAICPRIRSRYSHHKKYFHRPVTKTPSTSNKNNIQESSDTTKFTNTACTDSYFKRKSCFCHQPKKCDCKSKLNRHNPLESLLTKLYPDLSISKKEESSKQVVYEPRIQTSEDSTGKIDSRVDDEIMMAVSEWLKSIPVYPNFSANDKIKQEELAFRLAENLNSFKNDVDFISKAKMEIMSCLKDLPMWYPPDRNEKEQFLDKIVTNLLQRLVNILENELKCKIAQAISDLPYTEDVDIEKIVDDFVCKIKSIVFNLPEDKKDLMQGLKPGILNFLNELPIVCTIEKMHDVADKLIDQLMEFRLRKPHSEELISGDGNKFRENILKWCKNVPELKNINFAQNLDLVDELANKFQYYESCEPNDKSFQALVKKIRLWLEDATNTANLRLNSKIKNRISNKMANSFFGNGNDYNNTLNKRKSSEINISEEALEPLLRWYYDIQELAGGKGSETRKALDRLAKELKEIQSRDYSFEDVLTNMKEVITDWLRNMLMTRGKHMESKVFDNFVNKLISELNDIPKPKKQRLSGEYGQFYRDIITWLKDIPYLKPKSHMNQNKLVEQFANKLNNIRKRSVNESTTAEAIADFIQSLSDSMKVRIYEKDIEILNYKLFERLKHTSKQRKRWDKINDLCQSMLSEISNTMQAYSNILDESKLNNIKNTFYRKFIEHVEENDLPNWNYLFQQIINILKHETKLPKHEYEALAHSIIAEMQKMFPHEITRRSTILSKPVNAYVDPTRVIEHDSDATKEQKTKKNSNFPGSIYDKNKSKNYYRKKSLQAGDGKKYDKHSKMSTIYKSNNSDLDMNDSVNYYDKSHDISDKQNYYLASNKNKEFSTSTPLKTVSKEFPNALDIQSPSENVTRDPKKTSLDDSEFLKQSLYLMELKNVITDWIKNIDISIMKNDLDDIVDSIVSDIIDRQKYLQLSGSKYSENDELEHLKYQIFRNLNKFNKFDTLEQIMSKINNLHRCIKNISVPDLIKPVNESHTPTTSAKDNSIFNQISHWLDSLSSNFLTSRNVRQNPEVINKLVKNLENLDKGDQYDYQREKEILLWLQNVLRNCNDKIFNKLATDLKSQLYDTDKETTDKFKENTNEFSNEHILEAIMAWLQTTTFYKICNMEERYLQEKLAMLLSTKLKHILQTAKNEVDTLNDLLIEEIQNYLKSIPMSSEFRNNNFYYKTACELVEYLKQSIPKIKEIYDDINKSATTCTEIKKLNDFVDYKDLVKNIINNWCENLPIHLGHSPESKEQAKKLKENIAIGLLDELLYINLKEPNNDIGFEIMLSDKIDNMWNNVPMNRELERSLNILKSILIEKLKKATLQSQSLLPKKILHDTLTKTLQEIENTPGLEGASFNSLKEKLANAFINLHYHISPDNGFRDKFKEKLCNEINKFCNEYLARYPFSPMDSDDLRFNLYATLKKVSLPVIQNLDKSYESPTISFDKDVILKNATTQYSSPQFLPSTLSAEDRAHLEVIRKRAAGYPEKINSENPLKETGVQTVCKDNVEEKIQTSKTLLAETNSYNKEILPQVVIKEFYWDSSGSKQSLQIFVPPALTPHKIIPQKKDTNSSQNQTETNVINNSTKEHISQPYPDIREVNKNKVDKESNTISQDNKRYEKKEYLNNTYLNVPVDESQNEQTLISQNDSIHRQQHTQKPYHQYNKRRDTYSGREFDSGINERYWIEQPRTFNNNRCIQKDRKQFNNFENSVTIPDVRRIFLRPENEYKENMCCDLNTNWRMGNVCRRRCNTLKHCAKCCGGFCPHPSFAFFKKSF